MSTEKLRKQYLENVKRQAKRFSKYTEIPLTKSKELLAQCVYGTKSWDSLISQIQSDYESDSILLVTLQPNSDLVLFNLLKSKWELISDRLSKVDQLKNKNINNIHEILVNIFGLNLSEFKEKTSP